MVKQIHFGWFVRAKRHEQRKKVRAFARLADITEKRLMDIEKMPEPKINESTRYGIAQALGMTIDEFDAAWKSTPMSQPELRKSGHRQYGTRLLRVKAGLYASLERIAKSENKSMEAILEEYTRGRISEFYEEVSPPMPTAAKQPAGTRGRGSAATTSQDR